MRIFLIGFMGCGKSSLGRRLAKKLDYPFLDIDNEVERISGETITEIFSSQGEVAFREKEREVLHSVTKLNDAVIASGGGTPCYEDNMDFMLENGVTVYLRMSPESLRHRLEYAKRRRPLVEKLKGGELLSFIKSKLAEREAYYMRSNCIIKGESVRPDQVISLVFGY